MRVWLIQTAPLGDLILTLPLIRALHSGLDTEIRLVVRDGHESLAHRIPGVVEAVGKRDAGDRLRKASPDLVVSAHRSFRSGKLAWASGARTRIGFSACWGQWGWNSRVVRDPHLAASRRFLELLRPLNLTPEAQDPVPALPVSAEDRQAASAWLRSRGIDPETPWIAVAPGAAWATKRWPADRYRQWVLLQIERGYRVIAFGTLDERSLCSKVVDGVSGALSAAGETDLPLLASLVRQARLFLGNDSGTGHLASAVGTPVVTIFGPTASSMGFAPLGSNNRVVEIDSLSCRPCHRHGPRTCPLSHFRCMLDLSDERVASATDSVLRPGE